MIACALLVACKDDKPKALRAASFAENAVEVQSRRSTVLDKKVSWAGLVRNGNDRVLKRAVVIVLVRAAGGEELARKSMPLARVPPRYGVRVEVNGIDVPRPPENVEVKLEEIELAGDEEGAPKWKPTKVAWDEALPAGVSLVVEEADCGTFIGDKGQPSTFRCDVGVRNSGEKAVRDLRLRFKPVRGGEVVEVAPPHPTDLPIEPGDAVVFHVSIVVKKPSEMILTGTATPAR